MCVSAVTWCLLLMAKLPCEFFADILCTFASRINTGP